MEYHRDSTIACISNTKDAALFFDYVIPLNLAETIPWERNNDLDFHDVLRGIVPPSMLVSNKYILAEPIINYLRTYLLAFPMPLGLPFDKDEAIKIFPDLIKRQDEIFAALPYKVNSIFGLSDNSEKNIQVENPALILTGLELVDTSKISWRQIIEVRKDKNSMKNLRKLRAFIFQNYKDKPIAFIEDDLMNRIDLYKTTTKHLGLKTTDSTFKILFSSSALVSSTVATVASSISGGSPTIPLALSIGSAFFIGNIVLEVRSYSRDLYKFKQENPITYLIDINNPH